MNPQNTWTRLMKRLWPELATAAPENQQQGLILLVTLVMNLPLAILATVWLLAISDWAAVSQHWPLMLFVLLLLVVMESQDLLIMIAIGDDQDLSLKSSLGGMVQWAAVLAFGPTVLWASWLAAVGRALVKAWPLRHRPRRVAAVTPFLGMVQENGAALLAVLVASLIYEWAGGRYPLAEARPAEWGPAILATAAGLLLSYALFSPPLLVINRMFGIRNELAAVWRNFGPIFLFSLFSLPFAIPLALAYGLNGWPLFVFLNLGILLVNWLTHRLSRATIRSQLRARELAALERLGQAIIEAPADGSQLPALLADHLPKLFPVNYAYQLRIFEAGDDAGLPVWPHFDLAHPEGTTIISDADRGRLDQADEATIWQSDVRIPGRLADRGSTILAKIELRDGDEPAAPRMVGAFGLWYPRQMRLKGDLQQTVQEFTAQLGSALYQAQVQADLLAKQKMAQELAFAGRIQNSFLPRGVPQLPGWDIAASLIPARQTSGDFYDFVDLDDDRLAFVVADVADKGTGAALYMALSRTLIRTFAAQFPDEPGRVLEAANERLLRDSHSDQFVTVFYGVLAADSGRLIYANAGHNPGYVLGGKQKTLSKTGIPLGMFEGQQWSSEEVTLAAGETLVAYTDGVAEAQDQGQAEFGEARLLAILAAADGQTAAAKQAALVEAVQTFSDGAPQFDDITLMVLTRL